MTPTTIFINQPQIFHTAAHPRSSHTKLQFISFASGIDSFTNITAASANTQQHLFLLFPFRETLFSLSTDRLPSSVQQQDATPHQQQIQHPFFLVHHQRAISRCRLAGDGAGDEETRDLLALTRVMGIVFVGSCFVYSFLGGLIRGGSEGGKGGWDGVGFCSGWLFLVYGGGNGIYKSRLVQHNLLVLNCVCDCAVT